MSCSKTSTCLSIIAIGVSVVSIGLTLYKTHPSNVYSSIMKNLEKKQKQEMEKVKEKADSYIKSNYDSIILNQPFLGNEKGSKIIVKFSDYNCGHCKNAFKVLEDYTKQNSDVKVIIQELPILGKPSFDAAVIAHYIFEKSPEKFVKFHTKLMSGEGKVSAIDVGVSLGFTKKELESSLTNDKYKEKISSPYKIAQEIGIQGTPAFIINKKFLPGYIDKERIDEEFSK